MGGARGEGEVGVIRSGAGWGEEAAGRQAEGGEDVATWEMKRGRGKGRREGKRAGERRRAGGPLCARARSE